MPRGGEWLAAALAGLLALPMTVAATAWPDVPLPDGAQSIEVAGDMLFNGLPMSTRKFRTRMRPEEVQRFYREQ